MSTNGRIMTFLLIVLSAWTAMHFYAVSRLWSLPPGAGPSWHRSLVVATVLLWAGFPLGALLARAVGHSALPLQMAGALWIGVLFILVVCLLGADLVTGFGWLLPTWPGPRGPWPSPRPAA